MFCNVAEIQDGTRWCGVSDDGIGELRQIHFALRQTEGAKAATIFSEFGRAFQIHT